MVNIKIEEIRDDFKLYYKVEIPNGSKLHYKDMPKAEARVRELMEDISENGLKNPINVHKVENGYEVVEGIHRLEALRRLGWKEISCNIVGHGPQASPCPRGGDR